MKLPGDWSFNGHAFPGKPRISLKYAGSNHKDVLTKEAKRRLARTINYMRLPIS